jgi:hypothetical protein
MDDLSVEREAQLIQCTFGRADAWIDWLDDERVDALRKSLKWAIRACCGSTTPSSMPSSW